MKFTFNKKEKLKSEKLIARLFEEGQSVASYPLRMVYLACDLENDVKVQAGVSVSKRNFKSAVDRNRIKRLMREAYRMQKGSVFNNSSSQFALMILYIGKDKPDYQTITIKMQQLFDKFLHKISTD